MDGETTDQQMNYAYDLYLKNLHETAVFDGKNRLPYHDEQMGPVEQATYAIGYSSGQKTAY